MSKKLIIILLLIIAVIGGVFWHVTYQNGQLRQLRAVTALSCSDTCVTIGATINAQITIQQPWFYARDHYFTFDLPPGLMHINDVDDHVSFALPFEHVIRFQLLAMRDGTYNDAKLHIFANGLVSAVQDTSLCIDIPSIKVVFPSTVSDTLHAANEQVIPPPLPKTYTHYYFIIFVITLTSLIIYVLYRIKHRPAPPPTPPWISAEEKIEVLENQIKTKKLTLIGAVGKLSDILRDYLSARFAISANTMTTVEFFACMEKKESPLEFNHRAFLKDYMAKSDLIKFAGASAEQAQMIEAIDHARELIMQTTPTLDENEQNKGDKI